MLKKNFLKVVSFSVLIALASCGGDDETTLLGDWVEGPIFPDAPRGQIATFEIEGKIYIIGGYNYYEGYYYNEVFEYNPQTNQWEELGTFPGVARREAVGFSLGNKGYIGTGFDGKNKLKDFWEFNPADTSWTQIEDYPGDACLGAVSFSLGDYAYVGTGYSNDGDEYEFYKFSTDGSWNKLDNNFPGKKRHDASVFIIENKAYVGFGSTSSGTYPEDFYVFEPTSETWSKLTNLDENESYTIVRSSAVAFTINGKGYIGTGLKSSIISDFWKYDPSTDLWEEVTGFEGTSRQDAMGFVYENKAYVGMGKNGSTSFDDFWVFDPTAEYDKDNN